MSREGWHAPPAVAVVSGSEEFSRLREIKKAEQAANITGRRVMFVDAGDGTTVRETLSAAGVLFDQPMLLILQGASSRATEDDEDKQGWSDADVRTVTDHAMEGDADIALLIHHVGEPKPTSLAGKLLAAELPKKRKLLHLQFKAPSQAKQAEHASAFLVHELKERFNKTMSGDLADAVVRRVGSDLGQLSFEALKLAKFLDATGSRSDVAVQDVAKTLARMGDEDWRPLTDAVAAVDAAKVSRALSDLREGSAGVAGPVLCCAALGSSVIRWYHAAALISSGSPPEEAGGRMKTTAWVFSNFYAPPAKRWGKDRLRTLLHRLAEVERGSKGLHIAPWVSLEATLVGACLEAGYRPASAPR